MSAYARVRKDLIGVVEAVTAKYGPESADPRFVRAVETFPERPEDVAAYRGSLWGFAPEVRSVLEEALELAAKRHRADAEVS